MNESDRSCTPRFRKLREDLELLSHSQGGDAHAKLDVLEAFLAGGGDSPESRWACLRLAQACEERYHGAGSLADLDRAYDAYASLREHAAEVGTEALLGAIRIRLQQDARLHAKEIEDLCLQAEAVFPSPQAKYLLGCLVERTGNDLARAGSLYAAAAERGLVVAQHAQARMDVARGHRSKAFLRMHRFVRAKKRDGGLLEPPDRRAAPDTERQEKVPQATLPPWNGNGERMPMPARAWAILLPAAAAVIGLAAVAGAILGGMAYGLLALTSLSVAAKTAAGWIVFATVSALGIAWTTVMAMGVRQKMKAGPG